MATTAKTLAPATTREHVMALLRAFNSHDVSKIMALFTDDAMWEAPNLAMPITGRAAVKKYLTEMFTTFPDLHFPLEEAEVYLSEDGKKAVGSWHAVVTMVGPMDPPGFAPTGKTAYFKGVCLYDFRDGLISRHVILYDLMGLSEKLGLTPGFESLPVKVLAGGQRLTTMVRKTLLRR